MDEGRNMVMAYPSSFNFEGGHVPDAFAPSAHIFYGERVMDLDDDIPKVCDASFSPREQDKSVGYANKSPPLSINDTMSM